MCSDKVELISFMFSIFINPPLLAGASSGGSSALRADERARVESNFEFSALRAVELLFERHPFGATSSSRTRVPAAHHDGWNLAVPPPGGRSALCGMTLNSRPLGCSHYCEGKVMETEEKILDFIIKQTELITDLQTAVQTLMQRTTAMNAAQQIIVELLMAASPEIKSYFAEALPQILEKHERVQHNSILLDFLSKLEECSRLPSRTTPEGRRGWLFVVDCQSTGGIPPDRA